MTAANRTEDESQDMDITQVAGLAGVANEVQVRAQK